MYKVGSLYTNSVRFEQQTKYGYLPTLLINDGILISVHLMVSYYGVYGLLFHQYQYTYNIADALIASYIYDITCILHGKKMPMDTAVHHVFATIVILRGYPISNGFYILWGGGVGEISSIPLDIIYALNYLNINNGWFKTYMKYLFACLFMIIRNVSWSIMYFNYWIYEVPPRQYPITNLFVFALIVALQYYWGVLLVRKGIAASRKKKM